MSKPVSHNKHPYSSSFYHRVLSLFHSPGHGEYLKNSIFVSCLLAICITIAYTGAVPTHKFGHDIFFLLDNSWRIINGQRPQVDYSSAWGPLTFIILALGLKLAHFSVNGIGYGNALFGFVIGLWSYTLGRNRLLYSFRLLFSLFMVGLVVAPYALSYGVLDSTHAMVYNRYGYALLGLILLESMQPVGQPREKHSEFLGGLSTGAAVTLTLFLKISYFFAALLLIVGISVLFMRFSRNRLVGLFAGFSLIAIIFLAYLEFDIQSIFNELKMAAAARSESLSYQLLLIKFFKNSVYLPAVVLFGIASTPLINNNLVQLRSFQLPLLGALVFLTDLFLIFTNQQWFELPLIATFSLFVLNNVSHNYKMVKNTDRTFTKCSFWILFSVGSVLFLPIFTSQFVALTHGAMEKYDPPDLESVVRFTQPHLRDLLLYEGETPISNGRQYTTYVNEGVALLHAASHENDTVLTIDMFNPFPYALGRQPPSGGIAAAAYKYTLSDNHRPSDDKYFGNAKLVMVPRKHTDSDGYFFGFLRIYEPTLKKRYSLIGQSEWCSLYRRNN